MKHIATTSFGRRPLEACQMAGRPQKMAPVPRNTHDKWQILQNLVEARQAFGVSDRDLTVLSALLSFHPERPLSEGAPTIVFPSNRSLAARAHGMAESTLRRHLAALVRAGLIRRNDSPNGKRYARRGRSGAIDTAFGFDLQPLALRASDIAQAAQTARDAQEALTRLREETVLALRKASTLLEQAQDAGAAPCPTIEPRLIEARRHLRRKLNAVQLNALNAAFIEFCNELTDQITSLKAKETSGNDNQNERHIQDSTQITFESGNSETSSVTTDEAGKRPLSLFLVLQSCPSLKDYTHENVNTWQDLVSLSHKLSPMLGISNKIWSLAENTMGTVSTAITLACILQRIDKIRNPAGYLQTLAQKAQKGLFSPEPMVLALLNSSEIRSG